MSANNQVKIVVFSFNSTKLVSYLKTNCELIVLYNNIL